MTAASRCSCNFRLRSGWIFNVLACLMTINYHCKAWMLPPRIPHWANFRTVLSSTTPPIPSTSLETIHGPWNASTFGSFQCWGRQPVVLRKAFDCDSLPTWEEVLELACENEEEFGDEDDDVTSRLIDHEPGTLDTYTIEFGPFPMQYLKKRLDSNTVQRRASTLVVNDVDRYIREVSDWMDEQFDFIPRWRRDDAQVSLAPIGGGIGPHVDNYDVFLIQASGSREWQVGLEEISVKQEFASLVQESQVRILNLTEAPTTVKVELQAGDCLYLPPRIMHFGTSTSDDCVTLSVGCRAPSAADLVSRMAEAIAVSTAPAAVRRYADSNVFECPDKEISSSVKNNMKHLVRQAMEEYLDDDEAWGDIVGKLITEANRPTMSYPTPLSEADEDWRKELGCWGDVDQTLDAVAEGKGLLHRAEGIAFAWSQGPQSGGYSLYANGRAFRVVEDNPMTASLLCRLANGQPLDRNAFSEYGVGESASIRKFLGELIGESLFYGDDYET